MRLNEASNAHRPAPPFGHDHRAGRYSFNDYGLAAACAALLIAPAPFFWAPPLWVMALLASPGQRRRNAVDRGPAGLPAMLDDPPPLPVNVNRPPAPDEAEEDCRRAA